MTSKRTLHTHTRTAALAKAKINKIRQEKKITRNKNPFVCINTQRTTTKNNYLNSLYGKWRERGSERVGEESEGVIERDVIYIYSK